MSVNKEEEFQMHAEILQPWSTFVLKTQLPPPILEKMIEITDELLESPERIHPHLHDAGKQLEGQIEDEYYIHPNILKRENLLNFFLNMCRNYAIQASIQTQFWGHLEGVPTGAEEEMLKKEWSAKLISMWMVAQKDNEYNPIHTHMGDISAVMYLKIPEYLPNRKYFTRVYSSAGDKKVPSQFDGSITFVNNSSTDKIWARPNLQIQPQVGDFLIFPADQKHFVYPFRTADGKGERRSVSFNAIFSSKSKELAEQKLRLAEQKAHEELIRETKKRAPGEKWLTGKVGDVND